MSQRLLDGFGWTFSSIRILAQLLRRQWKSTRFDVALRCGVSPANAASLRTISPILLGAYGDELDASVGN